MHLIMLSQQLKDIASESPLFKNVPTHTIFNSVDLNVFKPDPSLKEKLREKYNIPQEKIILFYSSDYLSTIKGYKELIEILQQIKDKSKFHVLITGPMTTKNLDIPIPFTATGKVSHETMANLHRVSDITVIPSHEETFSLVAAESLACGIPVVAFKVGAIPELIKETELGYVAEVKDTEKMVEYIEMLATELYNNKQYSEQCRAFAEEHLSLELQAEKYYQVFKNAMHVDSTSSTHAIQEEFPEMKEVRYLILLLHKYQMQVLRLKSKLQGLTDQAQGLTGDYEKTINHLKSNDYYTFGQLQTKKKITGIFSLIKKVIGRKFWH